MAKNVFSRLGKAWDAFWTGHKEESITEVTPEKLQTAVKREVDLANSKADTAATAIAVADNLRKELAKLMIQHDELGRQALLLEKKGDKKKAKQVLALQLAIAEKIKAETGKYEEADKSAQAFIAEARQQVRTASEASQDLPRRVLQHDINKMVEKSRQLEGDLITAASDKPSFKALADHIDLTTGRLMAKNLIAGQKELGLDDQVDEVLKQAEFEKAYKALQAKAGSKEEIIEGEFIEKDPTDKARQLLSQPSFGGLLPHYQDTITVQSPPTGKIEVKDVSKEPDKESD